LQGPGVGSYKSDSCCSSGLLWCSFLSYLQQWSNFLVMLFLSLLWRHCWCGTFIWDIFLDCSLFCITDDLKSANDEYFEYEEREPKCNWLEVAQYFCSETMQTCVCVCVYTRCLCYLVVTLLTTCTFVCISIGWHKKTSRVTTNMSENTDTIEKLVLSREDAPAPEIRRTVSTKMTLMWIWLSHIGSFCFLFTYISPSQKWPILCRVAC